MPVMKAVSYTHLTRTSVEEEADGYKSTLDTGLPGSIATNIWYDIRIVLSGEHVRGYLDDRLIQDFTYPTLKPGPPAQMCIRDRVMTARVTDSPR